MHIAAVQNASFPLLVPRFSAWPGHKDYFMGRKLSFVTFPTGMQEFHTENIGKRLKLFQLFYEICICFELASSQHHGNSISGRWGMRP